MSMRVRTTAAAVVVVTVALAIAAFGLLVLQRKELVSHLDDVADVRAAGVASLVEERTLPRTLDVSNDDDALVRVVAGDGRTIAESQGFREAWSRARLPTGADSVVTTVGSVRVTVLPVGDDRVFVATSLEPVDDAINSLARRLAVGGPLLVALVGAITWLVVGRALRPVEAIRSEVATISARSLGRRVPVPATADEIGRLAATMNEMLDRVEDAVARQQRFVADASHELQTPLAAIRAELEVAPRDGDWQRAAGVALDE
ncbi:MAG: hypothetical protein QOD30_924, partial [Actinomycetota bacterium]|nr:hypothetical protein [Actinomycetota bacterium]